MMHIRALTEADAAAYWELRLRALREYPDAFGASAEEHLETNVASTAAWLRAQVSAADNFILGAWHDEQLVGMTGFYRERHIKARHKGVLWGMYVAPAARGTGVGRDLVKELIVCAQALAGLDEIRLCVVTTNASALHLYRAFGFETWGVEPRALKVDDQYLDEAHMVLRLR